MNFLYMLKVSLWIWIIAAMVLAFLLNSCNPYAGIGPAATVSTETGTPTIYPTPIADTQTPAPRVCIVKTGVPEGSLNIRTGAGIEHSIITTLSEGQRLILTAAAARGDWIEVTTNQAITGWINSRYCSQEIPNDD